MSAPLTAREAQVLALIQQRPHTSAEVAGMLKITISTASQYLRALRSLGLVHPERLGGVAVPWQLGHVALADLKKPPKPEKVRREWGNPLNETPRQRWASVWDYAQG